MVARRQFWLGPQRAGQTVRFWASVDVIHLSIAGARVKSLRSHLSTADLAAARARTARSRPARRRCPLDADGAAIEVDRAVNNSGLVSLGRPPGARRRDPRRPPRDRPHRTADADVPGPRHARAAPRPPQPAHPRADAPPAGRAPGRPATAATDRAGHRSAPRQRHRRDQRLPPARRRSAASTPAAPSPSTSPSTRSRRARRRNPHHPPHHHPARRRRQGQPAAPSPGNVNGTLSQRGPGNGASPTDLEHEPQNPYET